MRWFINKNEKTPLYLQLKDLVRYHISTGALQSKQRLPTVHGLAKDIGVNFETVRKAYKELEREGLVSTERGVGTFVSSSATPGPSTAPNRNPRAELVDFVGRSATQLLRIGLNLEEIKDLINEALSQVSRPNEKRLVLFVECNSLQAKEIAEVLRQHLDFSVQPTLLNDLQDELAKTSQSGVSLAAVITTGFHINEVRKIIGGQAIESDYVIANMSPETRRKLDPYYKNSRFGFVCRDPESKYYKDILQAELGIKSDISSCTITEKSKLTEMLSSVDVVLTTPSVFKAVKKLASRKLPVFNVQDRVDPLSLKMLKERMLNRGVSDNQNAHA